MAAAKGERKAQAAMEYLVVYGVVLLILIAAFVILYAVAVPSNIVPNACQFGAGGPACLDSVIGTNSVTSNTAIILFLSNSGTSPIQSPNAIVQINGQNSSQVNCEPSYIKPGGAIICIVNVTQKTTTNVQLNGKLYLISNYCVGSSSSCTEAMRETYAGTFSGRTQAVPTYKPRIAFEIASNSVPANGEKDQLSATVTLLGHTISGATVNFTTNSLIPILAQQICSTTNTLMPCTAFSNTNVNGTATQYIWSYSNAVVTVYANFSGAIASNTITFGSNAVGGSQQATYASCYVSGTTVNSITVNNINYGQYGTISPSSTSTYNIIDQITNGDTLQLNRGSNEQSQCYNINTNSGQTVSLSTSGNQDQGIFSISGNANVIFPNVGNWNGGWITFNDSGNGLISGTLSGNNNAFNMSSGAGNIILTLDGNANNDFNIITASTNMILGINGNEQNININSSARNANVVITLLSSSNQDKVKLSVSSGTVIVVPSVSSNGDTFNSIGGLDLIITSITSSGNQNNFYAWNEQVYVASCRGNNDKIYLEGSSAYMSSSPYNAPSGASC